jgi:hypothetical protein
MGLHFAPKFFYPRKAGLAFIYIYRLVYISHKDIPIAKQAPADARYSKTSTRERDDGPNNKCIERSKRSVLSIVYLYSTYIFVCYLYGVRFAYRIEQLLVER